MIYIIIFWLVCGVFAAIIANEKGRDGCLGFVVGFFLGPIGLVKK
jgi:hypothetical protein